VNPLIRNGWPVAGSFIHANETIKFNQQYSSQLREHVLSVQSIWFSFPASYKSGEDESPSEPENHRTGHRSGTGRRWIGIRVVLLIASDRGWIQSHLTATGSSGRQLKYGSHHRAHAGRNAGILIIWLLTTCDSETAVPQRTQPLQTSRVRPSSSWLQVLYRSNELAFCRPK
jgi:hypothetical protein